MSRLNPNDYGIGYDQGYRDGHADGYGQGYDDTVKEYENRIAKLVAEIRELDARVAVISRKLD